MFYKTTPQGVIWDWRSMHFMHKITNFIIACDAVGLITSGGGYYFFFVNWVIFGTTAALVWCWVVLERASRRHTSAPPRAKSLPTDRSSDMIIVLFTLFMDVFGHFRIVPEWHLSKQPNFPPRTAAPRRNFSNAPLRKRYKRLDFFSSFSKGKRNIRPANWTLDVNRRWEKLLFIKWTANSCSSSLSVE